MSTYTKMSRGFVQGDFVRIPIVNIQNHMATELMTGVNYFHS